MTMDDRVEKRLEDFAPWAEEREEDFAPCRVDDRLEDYADCVMEERGEDYAPYQVEDRPEDYASWVEERNEDCGAGNAPELCLLVQDLKAPDLVPKLRWSHLNYKEVVRLWNALSFHMWQYGGVMTVHIVILWKTLGVTDHTQARRLLGQYLNRCQKWGQVGFTAPLDRRRRLQRSLRQSRYGDAFVFRYIFTNECGGDKGFHSHVLASVPQRLGPDFETWSRRTLGKLAKHPGTETTVKVVVSPAKNEHDAVERQWDWFRYVCKQLELEPEPRWGNLAEPPQRLRDVLKLRAERSALPVTLAEGQLTGSSRDIRGKAQRAAGFVSELTSGDLTRIYDGHELEEYRTRPQEKERQKLLSTLHT
jgi:hypothetical protein